MISIPRFLAFSFSIFSICIFVASCSPEKKAESTTEQRAESLPDAIPIVVGEIHHGFDYQTIKVSGSVVSPNAPSTVGFLVPGKVVFVGPREGDFVKKGEKLAAIDPLDYSSASLLRRSARTSQSVTAASRGRIRKNEISL
jgi:multidrug efflux pump subunit AcrA (membrane-fusion protein)